MRALARSLMLGSFLLLCAATAQAHVGSAHVYREVDAGPYPIIAIVHLPKAIPGNGEMLVRFRDLADGEDVEVSIHEIPPQGRTHAPPLREAKRDRKDPNTFSDSLPIYQEGPWRIEAKIVGARGEGTLSVPILAEPPRPRDMATWERVSLTILTLVLMASAWQMLQGLGREGRLAPSEEPDAKDRRRGVVFGVVGILGLLGFLAFTGKSWHDYESRVWGDYADPISSELRLTQTPAVAGRKQTAGIILLENDQPLVAGNERALDVFLVKKDFSRYGRTSAPYFQSGVYRLDLEVHEAGGWNVFVELQRGDGSFIGRHLEFTAQPGRVTQALGEPLPPLGQAGALSELGAGMTVRFHQHGESLAAGDFLRLAFSMEGAAGRELGEARLFIAAHDAGLFAPVDSAPSTRMDTAGAAVEFPYGFPRPGNYRLFLQVEIDGRLVVAAHDVLVD